ncbi:hypothetical protein [Tahibacter soli]|uniref:EF-hand domain-containing protein n=1 Tax=Tahibacter soli TaxID=2983605 RepID=A0A9X3YHJ6_9GAMM|nr:hypothetical protein [Tahibacter soli]MDC8012381.1 hypothetical protein [Tahibacter soli]
MKPLFVIVVLCLGASCAHAQADRPLDNATLKQAEYPHPTGTLVVTTGQPAARAPEARPPFDALDRNGDGQIDEREAAAYITLANDFDYADTNRDHRVSRREFDRW